MTVDRAALRKLVEGWKPGMTVEVRVSDLVELLDLLDFIETRLVEIRNLARALVDLERMMEEP